MSSVGGVLALPGLLPLGPSASSSKTVLRVGGGVAGLGQRGGEGPR